MSSSDQTIAIIGAGMAGLSCAQALAKSGRKVSLFDKGRGPGGRMATRRADVAGETVHFDHGTQYFNALDPAFAAQCEEWRAAGAVADWPEAGEGALVGTLGMNAVIRHMAEPFDVAWGTRIESISPSDGGWTLESETSEFSAGSLICGIPAEQASDLMNKFAPSYAIAADKVESSPCWALMVSFSDPLAITGNCLRDVSGSVGWAARNSAKPGRVGPESWVIHASPDFTRDILELPREQAALRLLEEFFGAVGIDPVAPIHIAAHRWLYALPDSAGGDGFLWDQTARLGVCGDWLTAPNVEGAWLSGQYLASAILAKT